MNYKTSVLFEFNGYGLIIGDVLDAFYHAVLTIIIVYIRQVFSFIEEIRVNQNRTLVTCINCGNKPLVATSSGQAAIFPRVPINKMNFIPGCLQVLQ